MKTKKKQGLILICIICIISNAVLCFASSSSGSYEISVPVTAVNKSNSDTHFVIPNWEKIPFKDQRALNSEWLDTVNNQFEPKGADWWTLFGDTSLKCLAFAASSANDWLSLQTGRQMDTYINILNGNTETGTNWRKLEQIYFTREGNEPGYSFALLDDMVTHEEVPYDITGYADILIDPPSSYTWKEKDDSELWYPNESFEYTVTNEEYLHGWKTLPITISKEKIKLALERYGILYAHIHNDYFFKRGWIHFTTHAIPIIGYGIYNNDDVLWVHESYTDEYPEDNSKYKAIQEKYINSKYIQGIIAFYDPQWSTFHHDNRRTGFTTLKGDIKSAADVDRIDLVLKDGISQDVYARASAADMDGNDFVDVVVATSRNWNDSWVFGIEKRSDSSRWSATKIKWVYDASAYIEVPPSLGNVDGDASLEAVFGLENGTLIAVDVPGDYSWHTPWLEKATAKQPFNVEEKYSTLGSGMYKGKVGYTAIADIDLDGNNEVVFTDSQGGLPDWSGELYIIEYDGNVPTEEYSISVGNGGAWGAPSIANLDNDNFPEIVVPTFYGVKVYDFTGSGLVEKCSTSHGRIDSAAVIYDIDRDGQYEIIYSTTEALCHQSKSCDDKLYIIDPSNNCNNDASSISLSGVSRTTPAIADIDNDGDAEIIVNVRINDKLDPTSRLYCYEYGGSSCSGWPSNILQLPEQSPDIADIDADGDNEIIIPEYDSEYLFIHDKNGNNYFKFSLGGKIGAAPAIGDLDGDRIAEIAVKRAGSPLTLFTISSGFNIPPLLNPISNITARVGDLIDINASGEVQAVDPNGDDIAFYYGSPFNSSGQWQPVSGDDGNYSVVVEASDGNLSDYQYVNLIVFDEDTNFVGNFSDGSTEKHLDYAGSETKNFSIRLPKNSNVIYSEIRASGGSS